MVETKMHVSPDMVSEDMKNWTPDDWTKHLQEMASLIQGGFFNWSALKMTKCQITCKSLQKSSKCQSFLRVWHLVIFRADQLKKPPCIYHIYPLSFRT